MRLYFVIIEFLFISICIDTYAFGHDNIEGKADNETQKRQILYQSVNAEYLNILIHKPFYRAPSILGMETESLSSYIARNFHYPYDLIGDSISSTCCIGFAVDSVGCVTNIKYIKLSKDIPELAEEAQRVIKTLKFSGCPQRYDSIAGKWDSDTLGLAICFDIVPYPVEKISNKQTIIDELTKTNSYQYASNDGWGGTPLGWTLQQRLKAVTSTQEKKELFLTHKNSVVRITAFDGLVEENYPDCATLVKNSITDDAGIMCWSGDVGFGENLSDAMIDKLFSNANAFSRQDSLAIDSLILYSAHVSAWEYKTKMLRRMEATPERYARVKELCQDKQQNGAALYLLAKYRKKADIDIFIEALSEYKMGVDKEGAYNGKHVGRTDIALEAIISWPDRAFIPVLKKLGDYELKLKYHDYRRTQNFYEVIMEYDNDWAYKYLEDYFGKKNAGKVFNHPESLYCAYYLNKHPHERFLPLVEKYAKQPWDWKYISNFY